MRTCNQGNTAIDLAEFAGHVEVANLIRKYGGIEMPKELQSISMPINEISDFILHNTTALTAREQERKEKSYWLESDVVRAAGVPERAGL